MLHDSIDQRRGTGAIRCFRGRVHGQDCEEDDDRRVHAYRRSLRLRGDVVGLEPLARERVAASVVPELAPGGSAGINRHGAAKEEFAR